MTSVSHIQMMLSLRPVSTAPLYLNWHTLNHVFSANVSVTSMYQRFIGYNVIKIKSGYRTIFHYFGWQKFLLFVRHVCFPFYFVFSSRVLLFQ
jgi:hypothetical protein